MKKFSLNLADVCDRAGLHWLLQKQLELPDYYGQNLDALWDLLSEIRDETCLELQGAEVLRERLGNYADKFLITLRQAAEANAYLTIREEK